MTPCFVFLPALGRDRLPSRSAFGPRRGEVRLAAPCLELGTLLEAKPSSWLGQVEALRGSPRELCPASLGGPRGAGSPKT